MANVYVTNRWEKPIEFSYNYKPYRFPVNQTVEVPEEAARHIFGTDDPDKEKYLARLAIISTRNDIPQGLKVLEKIEISQLPPQNVQSLSPLVERVPLPYKVGGKPKESS
jgi:hypothetical protein